MDDDELRRGLPTSHVKFGEDVAILAGDGLFAEAVRLFCEQPGDPARVLAALGELAAATGVDGMVGGQYVDVVGGEGDAEGLRALHALKTGRLIAASVGVVLTLEGLGEPETIPYRRFADELGVLFQIVDDILDVTESDEQLGKPHGSDERHGKLTYVSLFGLDRARELAAESHAKATAALAEAARRDRRPEARRRLHLHEERMSEKPHHPGQRGRAGRAAAGRHRRPRRPARPRRRAAAAGRAGDAHLHHRHDR